MKYGALLFIHHLSEEMRQQREEKQSKQRNTNCTYLMKMSCTLFSFSASLLLLQMVMRMVHAMVSGCTPASNIFSNTVSALKGAFLSLKKMLKFR